MFKRYLSVFLITALFVSVSMVYSQNLVVGGDMSSEDAWNATMLNSDGEADYEFDYTDDGPADGNGGCLRVSYDGSLGDMAHMLFWQAIELEAGQYEVDAVIKDALGSLNDAGAWNQIYLSATPVNDDGEDWNPEADLIFDFNAWGCGGGGGVDGSYSENACGGSGNPVTIAEAGTYILGIKSGYWQDPAIPIEVLIDEVTLEKVGDAPAGGNLVTGGDMSNEDAWNASMLNSDGEADYEFDYTDDGPADGNGGCLRISYDGSLGDMAHMLFWQAIELEAGQYEVDAVIKDALGSLNDAGAWNQIYLSATPVNDDGEDWNPEADLIFDFNAWGCGGGGGVDGSYSENACGGSGNPVTITEAGTYVLGIKSGYWQDPAIPIEVLIDEVTLVRTGDAPAVTAIVAGGDMSSEDTWNASMLNSDGEADYEFDYTDDGPAGGEGGCLRISYDGSLGDMAHMLFWQAVELESGMYEVDALIKDALGNLNDAGAWNQIYLSATPVNDDGEDWNPEADLILGFNAWGCGGGGGVDGSYSENACGGSGNPVGIAEAGTYVLGIKSGYWQDPPVPIEVLIDNVTLKRIGDYEETVVESIAMPNEFNLTQNYPNPFNPTTNISFTLQKTEKVSLTIFNTQGQRVKTLMNENASAGRHVLTWNATDERGNVVPTGLYLYRLEVAEKQVTKSMLFMK